MWLWIPGIDALGCGASARHRPVRRKCGWKQAARTGGPSCSRRWISEMFTFIWSTTLRKHLQSVPDDQTLLLTVHVNVSSRNFDFETLKFCRVDLDPRSAVSSPVQRCGIIAVGSNWASACMRHILACSRRFHENGEASKTVQTGVSKPRIKGAVIGWISRPVDVWIHVKVTCMYAPEFAQLVIFTPPIPLSNVHQSIGRISAVSCLVDTRLNDRLGSDVDRPSCDDHQFLFQFRIPNGPPDCGFSPQSIFST